MTAEALPDTEIMIRRGHLDQLVAAVETVTVTEPCTAWCSGTCRGTHDIRPYFGGWSGKLQAMLAELDVPCKAGDLLAVLRRWSGLDPCHSYHQPAEAYCDQTGARIRRHPVGTRDAALALKAKITELERLRLVPVPDTADPGPPPGMHRLHCKYCGKAFDTKRPDSAKFCGATHRKAWKRQRDRERELLQAA